MKAQQHPDSGLEYQLRLLSLEVNHYRNTGKGVQHLVNRAYSVLEHQQAIHAAREALEFLIPYMEATEEETGVVMQTGLEKSRAALAQLKGVQP